MNQHRTLSLPAILAAYLALAVGMGVVLGAVIAPELGVLAFLFALAIGFMVAGTAAVTAMTVLDLRRAEVARVTS